MIQLAVVATWGIINRLRGWGNGWNGANSPQWLMWLQAKIFSRPILSAIQAVSTSASYVVTAQWGFDAAGCLSAVLFAGWWFGVMFGWGEYFDGVVYTNHEIGWIDDFTIWYSRFLPARLATSAPLIDNIGMGLRGAFYLPMFGGVAAVHACFHSWSWWSLLPAAFFWQDGAVYGFWRWVNPHVDYVRRAELTGGAIRGALIAAALYLAA